MKCRSKETIASVLTAAVLSASSVPAFPVSAQNFLFITEIRLESGENAYETLESAGYSVMAVGLNAGFSPESQVCLGYKTNTGTPITNIMLSADVGDSFDTETNIHYECASHTDVDAGIGSTGCLYVTHDSAAGMPLVGLDILRTNTGSGDELPAIPNDGAEIVRRTDGTPADLEAYSDADTIYLAQIHDGIVRPYISEIIPVTASDWQSAVYTAAKWGYSYYISGDIDTSADTYTLLACKRTADPAQAITSISAVSSETIKRFEKAQTPDTPAEEPADQNGTADESAVSEMEVTEETLAESSAEAEQQETTAPETGEAASPDISEGSVTTEALTEPQDGPVFETTVTAADTQSTAAPLTGDAIGVSGIGYNRVSRAEIPGDQPYYLYATKEAAAGNPISMLYVGETAESNDIMFGTWVSGFFGTKGATGAYGFAVNEDLYAALERDTAVYTRVPVRLLTDANAIAPNEQENSFAGSAADDAANHTAEPEAASAGMQTISLSFLTAKEGLPENRLLLEGLRTPTYETPAVAQYEVYDDTEHTQASAFQKHGVTALIMGGIAVVLAVLGAVIMKKHRHNQADQHNSGKTG